MKNNKGDRVAASQELLELFITWKKMDYNQLAYETKKVFIFFESGSREDCIQVLVMDFVNKRFI